VVRLPAWDCQPYDRVSPAAAIAADRTAALARLAQSGSGEPALIVATVAAVTQRCAPRAALADAGFAARAGQVVDLDVLKTHLARNGYVRAGTVMEPGDYAIRGGVVDVFPPGREEPIRLDFFGDTLESARAFDAESQRTTRQLKGVDLHPVSEALLGETAVARFRKRYVAAFGAITDGDPIYQAVSEGVRPQGLEHWLPFLHEELETVFDYLGREALVFLDHLAEPSLSERLDLIEDYHRARKEAPAGAAGSFGASVQRVLEPSALYMTGDEWRTALAERDVRVFSAFASDEADGAEHVDLGARPGREFSAERKSEGVNVFEAAAEHIVARLKAGKRVVVACWTEGASERTAGVLADHGVDAVSPAADWPAAQGLPKGMVARAVLPLEHGFETDDLAVISEQDILGDRLARPRKRRKAANFIAEAASLAPGDLVVHADHGLARYRGLRTLPVQDAAHDCLELEYAGQAKLFLPVENIELLSRYGSDDGSAALDKLGGASWQTRKAKAKQRLRDMAGELIKIAAARAVREAEPLSAPSGLYDEFCARFPFAETDDQLNAIDDALADLAAGRPMDRLICGDVGFGKTEVALRAAFAAAINGRQVAVIAPTTLLARQHFKTFAERFRGWPVKVRQLSRLVAGKAASEVRAEVAEGRCDVVVGTHALLAKNVTFKDLGLLIVDEEQHFGVRHKERLKELKADVHVLTLTATPIPRTLQMSLAGIRDLSIIATPPIDRLAVRTYVAPADPVTLREAVLRERYRGGQSFFVVPRIKDLPAAEEFLAERVPEAKYVVAHGQMAASELEARVTAFYEGEYDVLLSTPIVESGLDIPTANTMIIHRADMFGLAQLYQLRGRVGRSKTRAYAYPTTPADWKITPAAEKRLKVLQSLDTLGAGFTLASHDLDLRGGGNLLGEEQSGHIRDVGVELFQSMLEEAIASLKDEGLPQDSSEWSPQINVGASVLIPDTYVPDLDLRLGLYRRLSHLTEHDEREAFAAELIDRFGPLPEEVKHLMDILEIKALCRSAQIAKVDAGPKGAVAHFRAGAFSDPAPLIALVARRPAQFKLRPDETLLMRGDWPSPAARIKGVRAALRHVAEAAAAAMQPA
ncbi:MAG: transcription-repair coupling factor, partial [Caulobacterales bacterium]|nr:transcription-repair coupling factor [Caulobacterales bacterium]